MVIAVHLPRAPASKYSPPEVNKTTHVNRFNHVWKSLQNQESWTTWVPAPNLELNVSLTCSTGILPFQVFLIPKACLLLRGLGGIASDYKSVGNLGLLASSEEDAAAVAILQKWRKHFSSTMRIHNRIWQYIPLIFLLALHVFQHSPHTPKYRSLISHLSPQNCCSATTLVAAWQIWGRDPERDADRPAGCLKPEGVSCSPSISQPLWKHSRYLFSVLIWPVRKSLSI